MAVSVTLLGIVIMAATSKYHMPLNARILTNLFTYFILKCTLISKLISFKGSAELTKTNVVTLSKY